MLRGDSRAEVCFMGHIFATVEFFIVRKIPLVQKTTSLIFNTLTDEIFYLQNLSTNGTNV